MTVRRGHTIHVLFGGFRNWIILYSFCCFPDHFCQFNQHLRFQCGFSFDSCIFQWVELILVGIQRWKIEWNPWNYLSSFRITWCGFRFKPRIHLTGVRLKFWYSFGYSSCQCSFWLRFYLDMIAWFEHEETAIIAERVWNIYSIVEWSASVNLVFRNHVLLWISWTENKKFVDNTCQ